MIALIIISSLISVLSISIGKDIYRTCKSRPMY